MKKTFAAVATVALLAGCSSGTEISLGETAHIHNIATDGQYVFVGSHDGLYRFDQSWERVGNSFDVMGFTVNGSEFLASGHPGEDFGLPDPLGLIVSDDAGQNWKSAGLTGDVDFHFLRASGDTIIGVAANYGSMIKTTDGGLGWDTVEVPTLSDLAISPNDETQVLLASEGKLLLTDIRISEFSELATPAAIQKVVWFDGGILVADPSGIHLADSSNSEFKTLNSEFDGVVDIAANGNVVVVRDSKGIHKSDDRGQNFIKIQGASGEDDH